MYTGMTGIFLALEMEMKREMEMKMKLKRLEIVREVWYWWIEIVNCERLATR
jgi:hypothetical protein